MRAAIFGSGFIISLASCASLTVGQDYPAGVQMLYGTVDNDSLTVQCSLPAENSMRCSFAQTMVSRPADHKDFEGTLSKSIEDALSPSQLKGCEGLDAVVTAWRTGAPPENADAEKFAKGIAAMKPQQKADLLSQLELLQVFCANPNRETAETFLRAIRDKELKTCKVWTNTYEQNFSTTDAGKTWISNEGPKGGCGVIYISKFERAKGDFPFWTYSTQKVVTKKDGDEILNLCQTLDERVISYDWSGGEKYLNCVYIDFGF